MVMVDPSRFVRRCARGVFTSAAFAAALPSIGLADDGAAPGVVVRGLDFGRAAVSAPVVAPELRGGGSDGLLVVGLSEPMSDAVRDELRSAGLEPLWTDGGSGWVVRASGDGTVARAQAVGSVSEAGRMVRAHKLAVELGGRVTGDADGGESRYVLFPAQHGAAAWSEIEAAVRGAGGRVVSRSVEGLGVVAELDGRGLLSVLDSPAVLFCDAWSAPETDSVLVREMTGANVVESALGLTGAGVVGGVSDGGLYLEHVDFTGSPPVVQTANSVDTNHGTAVFGLLFGSGGGSDEARGLLPDGAGVFASYYEFSDRDAVIADLVSPDVRGVFQSNSWGSARTRVYTSASAEMDDIVFRRDVLLIQSQSNTGTQDSRPQAWAKNVVSVGGVQSQGTVDTGDDLWRSEASSGPGFDGRVKPDLVHVNDGLVTTDDDFPVDYRVFTGTSAATPVIAGHFGLFLEMWSTGVLGNPVGGGDVWGERPSAALARAALINTARPYPFESPADDLGRFRQGWGLPDLERLLDRRDVFAYWDHDRTLAIGERSSVWVEVEGDVDARFTMVYADPPGAPFALRPTVNDLDLIVESPSGEVFLGNAGLIESAWSSAEGEPDSVNTVENVFVPRERAEAGLWRVEVVARTINVDGWGATPGLDQAFALVATGGRATERPDATVRPAPSITGPVPTRGDWPISVRADGPVDAVRLVERRGGLIVGERELAAGPDGLWSGFAPAATCGVLTEMRLEAYSTGNVVASFPSGAGDRFFELRGDADVVALDEPFDSSGGWTASGDVTSGGWEWGVPSGGGLRNDPPWDADGDGACWVTDNGPGLRDVAGGPVVLTSPEFDIGSLVRPELRFDAWVVCDDAGVGMPDGVIAPDEDVMVVEASVDGGVTWVEIDSVRSTFVWLEQRVDLSGLAGLGDSVRLRFSIGDIPNNSLTEAGVDNVRLVSRSCVPCYPDFNGDDEVTFGEIATFLQLFTANAPAADCDGNGVVTFADVGCFVAAFNAGCAGL
jgi:serine protease AprX